MSSASGKQRDRQESQRWAAVAEPQLCVMEALGAQLLCVNELLERSFTDLSAQFVQMAQDIQDYRALTVAHGGEEAGKLGERIERSLMQSIVSMQFQDRVSQNLVITMDVLRELAVELEEQLARAETSGTIDVAAARELYHFLRLGEIRGAYLEALTRRGYIAGPQALGLDKPHAPQPAEDDIELF